VQIVEIMGILSDDRKSTIKMSMMYEDYTPLLELELE